MIDGTGEYVDAMDFADPFDEEQLFTDIDADDDETIQYAGVMYGDLGREDGETRTADGQLIERAEGEQQYYES